MALYVGSFKNTAQTAAHVIVTNMNTLMVSPYLGFSLYMTTRIGNFIG
jgi:Na+-driven multidrug efflux pump